MNQQEFQTVVDSTIVSTANLLVSKGEEYAGSADRLANFKRGANLTGTTPLQTALIYASKHYDSVCTYIKKDALGEIQKLSEPIEGRFDDLINYCILMKAIVIESRTTKVAIGALTPLTEKEYANAPQVTKHTP